MKISCLSLLSLALGLPVAHGGGLLGATTIRKLQTDSEDEEFGSDGGCPVSDMGYLQVNTVLSVAIKMILADGQLERIYSYNAGFGGGPENIADADMCLAEWDRMENPEGILATAIGEGKFKWCISEGDLGPAEREEIDVAQEDNVLQGIQVGDYYGLWVDAMHALTTAMSKVLHKPLSPEFVLIPSAAGFFEDLVSALGNNICYASPIFLTRLPYRELQAVFTCPTTTAPVFGVQGLASTDLSSIVANGGSGFSICVNPGTSQDTLAQETFPNATVVEVGTSSGMTVGVCQGICDAAVDAVESIQRYLLASAECAGVTFGDAEIIRATSGGDDGAITYRPKCS